MIGVRPLWVWLAGPLIRHSGTTYQLNPCVSKFALGPYDGHARRAFKSTLDKKTKRKLGVSD